ncbi:FG-GAP-like repeat-containing protein [Streptomyces californicus]|uniref:FG-GAP-like repeat-containing protein n=1 Tax=Streptomyces californicus TaxID=67351 RepID=UPI00332DE37D
MAVAITAIVIAFGASAPLATATDGAPADTGLPFAVEDGSYPNRADILNLTGADLIAGDGNISYTSCSTPHQIKVWARNLTNTENRLCFTAAGTGYLSVNIPSAFRIETYNRDLKASVSIDGTTENLTVPRNSAKGFGEANPADPKQAVLLEMRVTGTGTPVTPPPTGDTTYAFTGKLRIGETRSCTAVLVDPRWAATAKSCFADKPAENIDLTTGAPREKTTIALGRADLNSTGTHTSTVSYVVPRPDRDLALVRLDQPATGITPVTFSGAAPTADEALTLAGYGRTFDQWAPTKLHTSTLSAGTTTATGVGLAPKTPADSAICKGDAGAPILRDNNGKPELVAIASRSLQGGCLGESTDETRTNAVAVRTDNIKFGSRLNAGQQLRSGDSLVSASGALTMQSDGNLVIVSNAGKSLWSTRTGGNAGATARFDTSGNLIVRNAADTTTLWESKTTAADGSIVLTDRGNLVIYNVKGQSLWSSGTAIRHDYNGDGRSDLATWYDYADGGDALHTLLASPTGTFGEPAKSFSVGPDKYWADHMKFTTGDFNGDGRGDVAAFYGYDDGRVNLFTWLSKADSGFNTPTSSWSIPAGEWSFGRMTPRSGDFDGDGRDDIAVWYDYADGRDRLWTFTANRQGGFNDPFASWTGPETGWTASKSKLVIGDFDADGRDDMAALYDYGDTTVKLWTLLTEPNGGFQAPFQSWTDTTWGDWARTGIHAGDFNGDGRDDVAAWYDYADGHDGLHTFTSLSTKDGFFQKPTAAWSTEAGRFWYPSMKMAAGDYNGDGRDDLAAVHDYTDGSMKMWTWTAKTNGTFNSPLGSWNPATGWNYDRLTLIGQHH